MTGPRHGTSTLASKNTPLACKGRRTRKKMICCLHRPGNDPRRLMLRSLDEPFTLYGLIVQSIETDDARSYVIFHGGLSKNTPRVRAPNSAVQSPHWVDAPSVSAALRSSSCKI
jgi:hypothetical protein